MCYGGDSFVFVDPAALVAARAGYRVILTEETDWVGGQATDIDIHRVSGVLPR